MTESQQQPEAQQQPNIGSLISGLLGGQGGGSGLAKLLPAVLGMVSGGGLSGLMSKLQQGGLGEQAKTWVSPEASNAPVSGQQVTDALGQEQIDQVAQQAGVTPQEAADGLAQVLPTTVDKLTPQGQVPAEAPRIDPSRLQEQISKLTGGGVH